MSFLHSTVLRHDNQYFPFTAYYCNTVQFTHQKQASTIKITLLFLSIDVEETGSHYVTTEMDDIYFLFIRRTKENTNLR